MAARCLCNFFVTPKGGQFIADNFNLIFEALENFVPKNKNSQVAVATLLMNTAVFIDEGSKSTGFCSRLLLLITSFLKNADLDEEASLRTQVAQNTLKKKMNPCKEIATV